jgi:hypothetical protein
MKQKSDSNNTAGAVAQERLVRQAGWLPFDTAPTHGGAFLAAYMIGEKIKCYHVAHWDFDLDKFTYHPGAVRKPTHWHPIPIFEPNAQSEPRPLE